MPLTDVTRFVTDFFQEFGIGDLGEHAGAPRECPTSVAKRRFGRVFAQ